MTREVRAEHARVHINSHFNAKQQTFLDFVLSHYVSVGVEELNQEKLKPLLLIKYHNSIQDAVADLGQPSEIGEVVTFLLSDAAAYVNGETRPASYLSAVNASPPASENDVQLFTIDCEAEAAANQTITNNNLNNESVLTNELIGCDGATDCESRQSRKSAFILEVMRPSMFRSKSLTELSHQHQQQQQQQQQHQQQQQQLLLHQQQQQQQQQQQNTSINGNTEMGGTGKLLEHANSSSLTQLNNNNNNNNNNKDNDQKHQRNPREPATVCGSRDELNVTSSSQHGGLLDCSLATQTTTTTTAAAAATANQFNFQSYSGLIWQCADMNYTKYIEKYKEFFWLLVRRSNLCVLNYPLLIVVLFVV